MRRRKQMAKLTRRGFIKYTSVGAGTAGVLLGVLSVRSRLVEDVQAKKQEVPTAKQMEAPVVYIRDRATGEIGLLVGSREIVYRDPELVQRLLKVAQL
jgi:hypothetical protein